MSQESCQRCSGDGVRRCPDQVPAECELLVCWPESQAEELPPDADVADGDVPGKSVPLGTLRFPCGVHVGVLVLTSYRRRPRRTPCVPCDNRWFTIELL
jgi:hypothetical protein